MIAHSIGRHCTMNRSLGYTKLVGTYLLLAWVERTELVILFPSAHRSGLLHL